MEVVQFEKSSVILWRGTEVPFLHLESVAPIPLDMRQSNNYLLLKVVPVQVKNGKTTLACAELNDDVVFWAEHTFQGEYELVLASPRQIFSRIERSLSLEWSRLACDGLYQQFPQNSAKKTLNLQQKIIFSGTGLGLAATLFFFFHETLIAVCVALNVYYFLTLAFRFLLTVLGNKTLPEAEVSAEEIQSLDRETLPKYTILVPAYKEPQVLPVLLRYLRELDYPKHLLDVKILLEEDDRETQEAVKDFELEPSFEFFTIPPSYPRTKPKALNYALPFAQGEYLAIFDAEDRPEPDQLLKALVVFRRAENVACVQARLNYFNREENPLTRLFTIEYSQWFDFFLQGLYRLSIPLPLGGTSNHFRTQVLKDIGAWDPYNVTEDADLGLRLEKNGHRVALVNSTTWEEANTHVGNWIRQRSRWLKGHMQTCLVHTRHPVELIQQLGLLGFLGFCFFIGSPFVVALLSPLFWGIVSVVSFTEARQVSHYFPKYLDHLFTWNLIFGNVGFVLLGAWSLRKRKFWSLLPWAFHLPIYGLLQSVAAYRALWQLIWAPHHWDKTQHGLSVETEKERKESFHRLRWILRGKRWK